MPLEYPNLEAATVPRIWSSTLGEVRDLLTAQSLDGQATKNRDVDLGDENERLPSYFKGKENMDSKINMYLIVSVSCVFWLMEFKKATLLHVLYTC